VWQALGGFDEDFWMYLEDVDFAFRARLVGWDAVFAPGARVYHHISASGGDVLSSYYVGRNTVWTIAKNMPRRLLVENFPLIVAGQLRIALDALRNIRGLAARERLRGQLAGLLGLPAQLRKRRVIQAEKRVYAAAIKTHLSMLD
jgi:GT2 family glycosyltransferase